jgi:hypothetical protein
LINFSAMNIGTCFEGYEGPSSKIPRFETFFEEGIQAAAGDPA